MATIIDALIITLGFDASKFAPAAQAARLEIKITVEQAARAAKEIEASGKVAANFFTKLRNEALGLLAIFLGGKGIGAFVSDAVTSLSALGRAANSLVMPVEDLAAFRNMIQRTGGSGDAAEASLRGLSRAMQELITQGNRAIVPGLQQIGASYGDTPMEIMRKFAAFAEANKDNQRRVSQVGEILHIPQEIIDRLNHGVAGLDAAMRKSKELDDMTPGMTARAIALQEAWGSFREAADGLGRKLLDLLMPALTRILTAITPLIEMVDRWIDTYPGWATAITGVATAFLGLEAAMKAFGLLRLLLGSGSVITALFGGVAGTAATATAGIASVTTGVSALTTALTVILAPLAALAAWYAALHISSGAGAPELAFEKAHDAQNGGVPRPPPGDKAGDWYRRNVPQWMRHRDASAPSAPSDAAPPADANGGLQTAMGLSPAQYEAFRRGVAGIEHARYDQMGGSSGRFAGRYQMGAAEIAETARRLHEKAPTQQQFLADPGMQERFFSAYTAGHHATMMAGSATYRAMNAADQLAALAYAHNQGAGGAMRWMQTGQAGRDAFGTSGASYAAAVRRNLGSGVDPGLIATTRPGPSGRLAQATQNDNSSETHIGAITIQTQATDAKGIAASIDPAIRRRQSLVSQAATGLS